MVTFESSAFNTSEPKDYFINPCCFGDDVAKWLIERLHCKEYQAADMPGQEDFGWFFTFDASGIEHCFVIGHRPGNEETEGVWIGWLERSRGFVSSMLGGRKRDIHPNAVRAIHEILSNSPEIQNVRWHIQRDFDTGQKEIGTPAP
ncbi:MAG: hypothetical protein WBQ94_16565 [Terracidiphilus sp.]